MGSAGNSEWIWKNAGLMRYWCAWRSSLRFEVKENMDKHKIVEVEWFDAQSGFSSPLTIEELETEEMPHTFSVGYLIKEDKERIILGFMMFGEDMCKHWQLIPRGMIKKINVIKSSNRKNKW